MNSFLKNLSGLLLLNLLVKPVWIFFIDREIQNRIGYEAYGQYFSVLNLSYVLFLLSDAGLTNMINQQIARGEGVNLKQLFRIKALLVGVYVLILSFVAWLTHLPDWTILAYVIIIQVFTSVFLFMRSIITAHQYFYADAWFSVTDKLLMIVICGVALYGSVLRSFGLTGFLQVQCICTGVAMLIALLFLINKNLLRSTTREVTDVFKLTLPFAIAVILMSIHYRLDGFLLERIHFHGAEEAGLYAAAYRLLDASNMVGYLGASFLVPFLARNWNNQNLIQTTIFDLRHALVIFSIGVASFCIVFAPWLHDLLYRVPSEKGAKVIQLCMAVLPAYFLTHIYGSVFTANRDFKTFIRILAFSVLLNVALNLVLIPSQGSIGCAIAALVSQYACALACYIGVTTKYKMSFGKTSLLIYSFTAALLTTFFYVASPVIKNVWAILASGAVISLAVLATQLSFTKGYLFSKR